MPSSSSQPPHQPKSPPKQSLPLYSYSTICPNAQMYYIRYPDATNRAVSLLGNGPVGFDLEWKPNFVKGRAENPVALIQLATDQVVLLIQVSAMKEFPEKLKEFLENPDIVKAGVAIQNDALKLYRDWKVSVFHCVDLVLLARSVDNDNWKGRYKDPIGLSRLLEHYENLSLCKGKITRSNWENQLSYAQQEYAANDAHSGYTIYNKLSKMTRSMPVMPDPVYYTFDAVRGRLCEPTGAQWYPRNPNYDPGPPPPPKSPKPPRKATLVPTGESSAATGPVTNAFTPQLPSSANARHSIVTMNSNPRPNSWKLNQATQRPHSNTSYDGKQVALNNGFASHDKRKSRTAQFRNTAEVNPAQYRPVDTSRREQPGARNSSPTLVPHVSQHNYGITDTVTATSNPPPTPTQKKPRRRPRRTNGQHHSQNTATPNNKDTL